MPPAWPRRPHPPANGHFRVGGTSGGRPRAAWVSACQELIHSFTLRTSHHIKVDHSDQAGQAVFTDCGATESPMLTSTNVGTERREMGIPNTITALVGAALALAACQPSQVISSASDQISIETRGTFAPNPQPIASEHCAKHEKIAIIVRVQPIDQARSVYHYACR